MPRLSLPELELEYLYSPPPRAGGDTVLLIHGLGCQLIQWPEAIIEALQAAGFGVLRFDNRDVGLSRLADPPRPRVAKPLDLLRWRFGKRLPAPYTLVDMGQDALALMDHLGLAQVHLVGVSMGGMIAQELAIRHPQRLHSLSVIMSTSGARRVGQPQPAVMRALMSPPPSREPEAIAAHIAQQWRLLQGPAYTRSDEEILAEVRACMARGMSGPGFLRQVQAIMNAPNREARLRQVRTPTLVLHGSADPLVHCSGGKAVARSIPGARLELIEGWGHDWPPTVQPRLSALLLEHMQSVAVAA